MAVKNKFGIRTILGLLLPVIGVIAIVTFSLNVRKDQTAEKSQASDFGGCVGAGLPKTCSDVNSIPLSGCGNLNRKDVCSSIGCKWNSVSCSGSKGNCRSSSCFPVFDNVSCSGLSESACKDKVTSGCTPKYSYVTAACTTSTCSKIGCTCKTTYYCKGPSATAYRCNGLSYANCTGSIGTNYDCWWASKTTVSNTTYQKKVYSSCSGTYVRQRSICEGTGGYCTDAPAPTRFCTPGTKRCVDSAEACDVYVCNSDGTGEDYVKGPGGGGCAGVCD